MRTSSEIEAIFTAKGCTVSAESLGHSYRAGGEIFIFAPGVDPASTTGFEGFDGTGYDGRGRKWAVWLVTKGDYVPATQAEYSNASEGKRIAFGAEHRSCSNLRFFVHKDEKAATGLNDLSAAFDALGL